jgi:1,4-dihydroxy-2-naphthoyl-CoA hydrolase
VNENDGKEVANEINKMSGGWAQANNLRFVSITDEECIAEVTVAEQHLQPYGIVHGGVHCGVVETLCSIGAMVAATERGHKGGVVGLENHTSFIRATRTGATLRARATPITRGRTTQVWEAQIVDEDDKVVASGRVRLLCVGLDQLG